MRFAALLICSCAVLLADDGTVVDGDLGKKLDDFCWKELIEPAGLVDTGFIRDPKLDAARASTRRSEGADQGTCVDWHWGWGYRGMGGVVTTVYDMLAWDRALRGDKVLDAKAREKLYRVEKESYAYGWMMETTSRGTTHAYHGGGVAGYGTWLSRHLEEPEGPPLEIEQRFLAIEQDLHARDESCRIAEGVLRAVRRTKPPAAGLHWGWLEASCPVGAEVDAAGVGIRAGLGRHGACFWLVRTDDVKAQRGPDRRDPGGPDSGRGSGARGVVIEGAEDSRDRETVGTSRGAGSRRLNRQAAKDAKMMRKEPDERTDALARAVIGVAIEVHRLLGPGYL